MKKFKFKLEAVLKERERFEKKKLQELILSQHILNSMIENKNNLSQRLQTCMEQVTDMGKMGTNSSANFYILETFIEGTKKRIEWKQQEISRGTKLTDKKKSEYIEANKKKEVLEQLKDREFKKYKEENKKIEQKILDDIYITQASRVNTMGENEDL